MIDFSEARNSPRGFMIGALFDLADEQRKLAQITMAFAMLWMSFNAWGTLVTGGDTDAEMIRLLAKDVRLDAAFRHELEREPFRTAVVEFASFWPIFSNGDIGVHKLWPRMADWYDLGREGTARQLSSFENKKAKRGSNGAVSGGIRRRPINDGFSRDRPSWKDVLETLYMVRNNIMHGQKSFDSDDSEIIRSAHDVLRRFVTRAKIYEWR